MSIFLRDAIVRSVRSSVQNSDLGFVRNPIISPRRFFSVSSSDEDRSFVVSYLVNSLGLSPKAALTASTRVKFDSSEKPDKTLEFFKANGFTHAQFSSLARIYPKILVCNVEKTILPKFEFLLSQGISGPELARGLSYFPALLYSSLEKQIKPAFEFFRDLFWSNEMMVKVVTQYPQILTYDIEKHVRPNIATLRQHNVPDSRISVLIDNCYWIIRTSSDLFREIVNEVVKMGFNPSKSMFVLAVGAIHLKQRGSKWESKVAAYKKWGWSDEEVMQAFRKDPRFMLISQDKIAAAMAFFITEMGLKPQELANDPFLFTYSIEKRVIPRVSLYRILLSRGLLKKKFSLSTLVVMSEKKLLMELVTPYAKEAPDLLKLYQEKLATSRKVLRER